MLLILGNIALIVRSVSHLHALLVHSSPGQKLGFLICWNVEHGCVAHALKLLFENCELNCTELSEKTAGKGDSCIDK